MSAAALGPRDVRVHVAHAGLEAGGDDVLDDAERARAAAFVFERDSALFRAAHVALRRVLARYVGLAPRDLAFEAGAHGRPELAGAARESGVRFSLAHSGDRALIAVARARVGCDVEVARPGADLERLAARAFTPLERAGIAAHAPSERAAAFYRVWTRKEAYVKALGLGLSHPLDAFDVSAGREARFLAFRDGSRVEAWTLADLDLGPGRAAAVCAEIAAARITAIEECS